MFHLLGRLAHDHRLAVIVGWIIVATAVRVAAPRWTDVARDSDIGELPAATTTARGIRLNAASFPNDLANSQIVFIAAREEAPLTPEDRELALAMAAKFKEVPNLPLVGEIWTEKTPFIGEMLRSGDNRAVEVVARLTNDFMAVDNVRIMEEAKRIVAEARQEAPAGLEIGVTGTAAVGGELLAAIKESLRNTEWTTIAAVVIALGLIYRSPWLVIVPLGAIAVATIASINLLALLASASEGRPEAWLQFRVFSTTRIFVVVLLFGATADFCLFLISRFRELRGEGRSQREAVIEATGRVGGAITASALTTIVGLLMMVFSQYGKFAYSGPAIALSLAIALFACLTLGPALLSTWIGRRVGVGRPPDAATVSRRFWSRLAELILARPGVILAVSLVAAAPLAWAGARAGVTYDIFSELPAGAESRRGAELIRRHLAPGEIGPLTVLVRLPGVDFASPDERDKVAELTKTVFDVPGVVKVRSLYRPTGLPPGAISLSIRGLASMVASGSPVAKDTFVAHGPGLAPDVTRLTVVLADSPFSPDAVGTVDDIEQALKNLKTAPDSPWRTAQFEMLGASSGIRDIQRITTEDRRRIERLVTLAVFLVILALLRRPIVCAYLIATVVGNYFVTLGAVDLILRTIQGEAYVGLDWKAPIFLFVILVAVGQDYNIFLVSRVFEEQRRLGPVEGLRHGLVQTGGIITSCGVIMAATFGSMMAGSLPEMAAMGLALALGILLDTFVVRTILAPAFLALMAGRGALQRSA